MKSLQEEIWSEHIAKTWTSSAINQTTYPLRDMVVSHIEYKLESVSAVEIDVYDQIDEDVK